jgi:UDP-N-acetylglucosamine 4,6-dehydratase/5-epimerase
MINNKSILITGGTGSFGKEMLKTLLKKFKAKKIVVFSRDELKQSELEQKYPSSKYKNIRYFIGDVRDYERLKSAFNGIDIVIHAAALKQVTTAEYNPIECIKTNINGAENVIKAAFECDVKKVVALSTDKAVNPINLYGATKLVSEKLFISANNIYGDKQTRFSVVRYGNVIGSRGSVVDVFKKLINQNVPCFPITDKRMTRFWMTLAQSVELVLNSIKLMQGGETYIPKIPSIKITDLAKAMSSSKKIKIIGIRPGEKINELLCSSSAAHLTLEFDNHYVVMPSTSKNISYNSYKKNKVGKIGKPVISEFEYTSEKNEKFLSVQDIKKSINN